MVHYYTFTLLHLKQQRQSGINSSFLSKEEPPQQYSEVELTSVLAWLIRGDKEDRLMYNHLFNVDLYLHNEFNLWPEGEINKSTTKQWLFPWQNLQKFSLQANNKNR